MTGNSWPHGGGSQKGPRIVLMLGLCRESLHNFEQGPRYFCFFPDPAGAVSGPGGRGHQPDLTLASWEAKPFLPAGDARWNDTVSQSTGNVPEYGLLEKTNALRG